MPYPGKAREGNDEVRRELNSWWGHPFTEEQIARAVRSETEHSAFADPGPDWNLLTLFDVDGNQIAMHRQNGF